MTKIVSIIVVCVYLTLSCTNEEKLTKLEKDDFFCNTTFPSITEEIAPDLILKEGLLSQKADTVRILRNGDAIAVVELGDPIIVAQAETEESWGFFQFPIIFRAEDGKLIVYWQMKADSYTAYGEEGYSFLMSEDEGETWKSLDKEYFRRDRGMVELSNGDILQQYTSPSKDINDYSDFPKPINTELINLYTFYPENEIPKDLQGIYFHLWNKKNNESIIVHANLNDPYYLKYAIDGLMPIVWWGNIKLLDNDALVAGVYPCFYMNKDGNVLCPAVSFYKSIDGGLNWDVIGKIYYPSENDDVPKLFNGKDGFTEPTFEVLEDGTYICVMRTGNTTPLYKTFSNDGGLNWSPPVPFTPNGVMPNLLLLDNGVLVLASGRPGLQVRFSFDNGRIWTNPIEMLPFENSNGKINIYEGTCGYPSILKVNRTTFYIVYSDFLRKNKKGERRKSIMFRKIEVIKAK